MRDSIIKDTTCCRQVCIPCDHGNARNCFHNLFVKYSQLIWLNRTVSATPSTSAAVETTTTTSAGTTSRCRINREHKNFCVETIDTLIDSIQSNVKCSC